MKHIIHSLLLLQKMSQSPSAIWPKFSNSFCKLLSLVEYGKSAANTPKRCQDKNDGKTKEKNTTLKYKIKESDGEIHICYLACYSIESNWFDRNEARNKTQNLRLLMVLLQFPFSIMHCININKSILSSLGIWLFYMFWTWGKKPASDFWPTLN